MKIKNFILGLFVSAAVLVGCEQTEELGPAALKTIETSLVIPLEGGSQVINLKATRDWTATVTPADCGLTVTPASGTGSGDPILVTVSAEKNTGRNLNALVTFSSGAMKPVTVRIAQEGELGALYYANEIQGLPTDTAVKVEGVVMAVNTKGFVLKDDTGLILVYNKDYENSPSSVGKRVKIDGKVGIYGNLKRVVPTTVTEDEADAVEVVHGEPVNVDAEYLSSPVLDKVYYMTMEGIYRPSADKKYHNVILEESSKQGSLQYPVQDLSSVVDHKVRFYGYFAGGNNANYYNFLVTSFEDKGEVKLDLSTIAQALSGKEGSSVKVKGTVAAVSKKSLILKDETGVIYVYINAEPSVAVGADVEITGQLADPYDQGFLQISSPKITALETTSEVNHGTAREIKLTAGLNSYINSPMVVEYVSYEGVVKGYDILPTDGVDGEISAAAYYYSEDLTLYEGMTVTLSGYAIGKDSSGKKLNVVVTSIETDPFLNLGQSAMTVNCKETSVSFSVDAHPDVEWTVSAPEGFTAEPASGKGSQEVTVSFIANAQTTPVVTEITVSTTAQISPDTRTFTLTQEAHAYALIIKFDFTDNETNRIPTANGTSSAEYTLSGYKFTISSTDAKGFYFHDSNKELTLRDVGLIGFPAIPDKSLTKVVVKNSPECATSVSVSVRDKDDKVVTGGDNKKFSTKDSEYTYTLSGTTANTSYFLKNTAADLKLVTLTLYYE